MHKMLIVDDQIKEIEGIIGLIDWSSIGIEIVGYANNGKEGLEKIYNLNPDIIITDVVMPVMDGIEMIKQTRKYKPDEKVIFISCFDDFKFVSRAIEQGTYAYVLKPILPSEFIDTVNKVLGICEEESKKSIELIKLRKEVKDSRNLLIEQYFKNLFFGLFNNDNSIKKQAEFLEIDVNRIINYRIAYFEIISKVDISNYFNIISIIDKLREKYPQYYFILTDLEHIGVILTNISAVIQDVESIIYGMVDLIKSNYKVKLCVGISDDEKKITRINFAFLQSKNTLEYKFYVGEQKIIFANYVEFNKSAVEFDFININNEIKKILFSGDENLVNPFLISVFSKRETENELKYKCITIINSIYFHISSIKFDIDNVAGNMAEIINKIYEINNYDELITFLEHVLIEFIEYVFNKNKSENSDVVNKMKKYINDNIEKSITIKDVSEHFYFSQGYATYIFKNITEKTIHQYIEETKIERAIYLLKNNQVKIYEIAEKLGYSNSGYFINVFKKKMGCTPTEFQRENIL